MNQPTVNAIETYSGRFVDVSDPQPDDFTLRDVAHALANICRFGGHPRRFYSVAEHAVFVSIRLERQGASRAAQLLGLHHDDAEAYLGDIPRPIKPLLGDVYMRMTQAVDSAIRVALDLPEHTLKSEYQIKAADNFALMVEAQHLLTSRGERWTEQAKAEWGVEYEPKRIITPDYWRGGIDPYIAQHLFIARHRELTR